MTSRLLAQVESLRTFIVIFATGEEPIEGLKRFARENQVAGAQLTGVGAFQRVTIGFFDWQRKDYLRRTYDEQMEVLTLAGNIATKEDAPEIHAHVALAKADGTAHGGHLLEANVRPTLEVIVTETPAYLRRRFDSGTGLYLLQPPL